MTPLEMARGFINEENGDGAESYRSILGRALIESEAKFATEQRLAVHAEQKFAESQVKLAAAQAALMTLAARLVRLTAPDDAPEDMIPRVVLVDMALDAKAARDGGCDEFDAALTRAREDGAAVMREAAIKVCQQEADEMLAMPARGAKWCASAIAALPTGGAR